MHRARILRSFAGVVTLTMPVLLSGCGGKIVWRPDLGGAMDLAAREDRIVIVAYWSTFNRDCMKMDQTVFRSDRVVEVMAGTVPVRLDAAFSQNQAWAREVGVGRIPSFVAYGPTGALLRRHEGYLEEAAFRAFVVAARLSQ